jgi:hypothetical protein
LRKRVRGARGAGKEIVAREARFGLSGCGALGQAPRGRGRMRVAGVSVGSAILVGGWVA